VFRERKPQLLFLVRAALRNWADCLASRLGSDPARDGGRAGDIKEQLLNAQITSNTYY